MSKKSFVIPAGTYAICDPCYVVEDHQLWMNFLENSDYLEDGMAQVEDLTVYAGGTSYGDGTYTDNMDYNYFVDAGLIGIVSWDDVQRMANEVTIEKLKTDTAGGLGRLVLFEDSFRVVFSDEDPTHRFGDVLIYTGDEYEEISED